MTIHYKITKDKSRSILMIIFFLFLTVPSLEVYAKERITDIDTPKISTRIDIYRGK
jgi:hypothetical protein